MKHARTWLVIGSVMALLVVLGTLSAEAQGPTPKVGRAPNAPVGTAFTYQGQLKKNGTPVNANCQLQFNLYGEAPGGGSVYLAGPVTGSPNPVAVTNGLFTVQIDFGANKITGDGRWLQTSVACPGDGSFNPLPIQPLTPAPMALALPGMYTQQNATSPNVIGGFSGNVVSPTVLGGTIGGGGASIYENKVLSNYATVSGGIDNIAGGLSSYGNSIGGGLSNHASDQYSTIAGGETNIASGYYATVGGGGNNLANDVGSTVGGGGGNSAITQYATVGGGLGNTASNIYTTVGGGINNTASGIRSAIPGGTNNLASGDYSLAAGSHANAVNSGAFVWADSAGIDFTSTANDQFLVRAAGGVGINTTSTTANALTVNGKVIAGGTGVPSGSDEPIVSRGVSSGISMDDRAGGVNPRWVMYPTGGSLNFYNSTSGSVANINGAGKITANGGFSGRCLSSGQFNTSTGNACNMDFAESFKSVELTAPGDLVALVNTAHDAPTVGKSTGAYQDLAIGVVSTNPGLVFDNGATFMSGDNSQLITANKTIVALVGRVPVKVSMENGVIAIGDPLTSASLPGRAMKATRAGKIIGYAMESATTDGAALALIQPGYYLPAAQIEADNKIADLETRLATVEQNANTMNGFAFGILLIGAAMLYRAKK